MLALAHGAGLEAGQVRARARLAIALAPPVFAAEDAWKVMRLLHRAAELHDHRGNHVDAEGDQARCAEGGAFFFEQVLLHHAPTGATKGHRPIGCVPAAPREDALPALVVVLAQALAQANFAGDVCGQRVT
ncbi:hypothetical protein D9M71_673330 [compost metagenome]